MKTAKIIILAGQSNAVGVGHVRYLQNHFTNEKTNEFLRGYPSIRINYISHDIISNGFVGTTVACSEKSKVTFGHVIGIEEQMNQRYPDENKFIVKCAVGSTALHSDWNCHSGKLYKNFFNLLFESIKILENQGYTPRIKAFCWMQGESDADTPEHVSQYIPLYDELLTNFKETFENYLDSCTYIDGGISEVWDFYKEINQLKIQYASNHKNHYFIDTIGNGLTTANEPTQNPDIAHYDSGSMIKLGRLFAEKIKL